MSALHTAAAALTLVPLSHWTAATHRANIASYIGTTQPGEPSVPGSSADTVAADKAFKKELYHYLRWALLGGSPGVGIPAAMEILGRDESVRRILEAKVLTETLVAADNKGPFGAKQEDSKAWMGSLAGKA